MEQLQFVQLLNRIDDVLEIYFDFALGDLLLAIDSVKNRSALQEFTHNVPHSVILQHVFARHHIANFVEIILVVEYHPLLQTSVLYKGDFHAEHFGRINSQMTLEREKVPAKANWTVRRQLIFLEELVLGGV